VSQRTRVCPGCGRPTAILNLIHTYSAKSYCSKGCLAKARWKIEPAP
jgi:hypothetical protein